MYSEEMTVEAQLRMFVLEKSLQYYSKPEDVVEAAKAYLAFIKGEK